MLRHNCTCRAELEDADSSSEEQQISSKQATVHKQPVMLIPILITATDFIGALAAGKQCSCAFALYPNANCICTCCTCMCMALCCHVHQPKYVDTICIQLCTLDLHTYLYPYMHTHSHANTAA